MLTARPDSCHKTGSIGKCAYIHKTKPAQCGFFHFMPKKPSVHKPRGAPSTAQNRKDYDQARGTATQRGYDSRWRKARATFLAHHPLCVACLDEGRTVAANEVDHIIPHRGNMGLFWDKTNWQALCKSCHSRKTALEGGRKY